MKRALLVCMGVLISLSAFAFFTDVTFPINLQGTYYGESQWGDYDNDGDLDLITTGQVSSNNYITRICRNNGDMTFTDINAGLPGLFWSNVAWGDYDNDGDLDILITGDLSTTQYCSRIYRNDGNDTFTDINAGFPGLHDGAVAWADMDNDGDLDCIVSGMLYPSGHVNTIYRNDGNDTFTAQSNGFPLIRHSSYAWGDYDNDNDPDLLMCGYVSEYNYISRLYRNDGNFVFTDVAAGLQPVFNSSVRWGDYDADGDLDILLCGQYRQNPHQSTTKIYRNNSGVFSDANASIIDVASGSAEWADFDNDGDLDVAVNGYAYSLSNGVCRVYQNNGAANFSLYQTMVPSVIGGNAVWGDFNNDGYLDVIYSGNYNSTGKLLFFVQDVTGTVNSIPSAPTGLYTTTEQDFVIFHWQAAEDLQTPSPALNYSLRVGTTPGGSDILAAPATQSGYRKLPQLGIAGQACSWKLRSSLFNSQLNYYWSVQAVDGALAGSAFAGEAVYGRVRVIAPNGGEAFPAGSVQNIVWSASTQIDSVRLLFSADNGNSWNYVSDSPFPAQQGILPAETPYMVLPSCRIRVEKAGDPYNYDDSDQTFALTANPPLPPDSVQIVLQDDSALVSWQPVTQTIFGTPFDPDYYIVFYNGTSDVNGTYYYLGRTYSEDYVHDGVALHASNMYYHVRAFRRERSRTDDAILDSLTSSMTEAEVLELLK